MNPPAENSSDAAAIRAEIDQTRHRIDETIDALGERFKGRHLVDEALHFFRSKTQNGNMNKFKDTLTRSANSAAHSVVDTVKANPIPLVLIGAGVAYYLYNRAHANSERDERMAGYRDYRYSMETENGGGWDEQDGGRDATAGSQPAQGGSLPSPDAETSPGMGERLHEVGDLVRDKAQAVVQGTREMGAQVAARSGQLYREGRDRVASTIEQNPLQSGLICLAVGLLAGIALPTSEKVRRQVGPPARALRRRADSMVAGGRQMIRRATEAAREEAKVQGLTMESLKEKAGEVGQAGAEVAKEKMREQELPV